MPSRHRRRCAQRQGRLDGHRPATPWPANGRERQYTRRSGTAACEVRAPESSRPARGAVPRRQRPGPPRLGAASRPPRAATRPGPARGRRRTRSVPNGSSAPGNRRPRHCMSHRRFGRPRAVRRWRWRPPNTRFRSGIEACGPPPSGVLASPASKSCSSPVPPSQFDVSSGHPSDHEVSARPKRSALNANHGSAAEPNDFTAYAVSAPHRRKELETGGLKRPGIQ